MTPPPSGVVTVLFTDIERAGRSDDLPEQQVRIALTQHDRLLIQTVQEENGSVFTNTGDAFRAVFADAPSAARAAVKIQLALHNLGKKGGAFEVALRVRIVLNTGSVEGSGGFKDSPLVQETQSQLLLAHAGQILLSDSTREAVQDTLPFEVSLHDLGLHGIKDRRSPIRLWQICHPDLPSRFPEIRAAGNFGTNISDSATAFIGRKRELTELRAMFAQSRVVTLVGPEGIGKTRLAMEVSQLMLDSYPDGVWIIPLASLTDESHIPQAVARVFGLREKPGISLLDTLIHHVQEKRLLFLFDHYNSLAAACSEFAQSLLNNCPHVHILATGCNKWENAAAPSYQVPPLGLPPMPESNEEQTPPYTLVRYESIRLFLERVRLRQSNFLLTPTGAAALCRLCHRLNGAPLALELAAARIGTLTVEQVATYLANYYLRNKGAHSAQHCPQPLRVILDWTYALLELKEKVLLLRLAVFPGSWSLEAAKAICSDADEDTVPSSKSKIEKNELPRYLQELVEKSLVVCLGSDGQARYTLPHAIRRYALERLEQTKEGIWIRDSHCSFFFQMAERACQRHREFGQNDWHNSLEREYDNLRQALDEALNAASAPTLTLSPRAIERLLLFAGSLEPFWRLRGYITDGRHYLAAALSYSDSQEDGRARAFALIGAANLARRQREMKKAAAWYQESLTISRRLEDKEGIALALDNLAQTAREQGDYRRAKSLLEQAVALNCQSQRRSDEASNWNQLGSMSWVKGDYDTAIEQFSEALVLQREVSHDRVIANAHTSIGLAALERGDFRVARNCLTEGLKLWNRLGDQGQTATILLALAKLAWLQEKAEWAVSLFDASREMRGSLQGMLSSSEQDDRQILEAWLRARLDEVNYEHAAPQSEVFTVDQILARLQPPDLRIVEGGNQSDEAAFMSREANLT